MRYTALSLLLTISANAETYQGYIEGKFVRLGAPVSGQLEKLWIKEGDPVVKGQVIAVLESEHEQALKETAQAKVDNAKEILVNLEKSNKRKDELDAIEASLEQAKSLNERNKIFYKRQKTLVHKNAVSQQQHDDAQSAYEQSTARVRELEAQLRVGKLAARDDEIDAAEANLRAAQAELHSAQWTLDQKTIKSSTEGYIFERYYYEGEQIPANTPIVSILPNHEIKVR